MSTMREDDGPMRPRERLDLMVFNMTQGLHRFDITPPDVGALEEISRRISAFPVLERLLWPEEGKRPSPEEYVDIMALWVSSRSTCPRARVGAVIHRNTRILSAGYNGAPPGKPHCDVEGCILELTTHPDTDIQEWHCRRSNHAELNAMAHAARYGIAIEGAQITVTHTPCRICVGVLESAGISEIRVLTVY